MRVEPIELSGRGDWVLPIVEYIGLGKGSSVEIPSRSWELSHVAGRALPALRGLLGRRPGPRPHSRATRPSRPPVALPALALALVLLAAGAHALWNLLAKTAPGGGAAFVWLASVFAAAMLTPPGARASSRSRRRARRAVAFMAGAG